MHFTNLKIYEEGLKVGTLQTMKIFLILEDMVDIGKGEKFISLEKFIHFLLHQFSSLKKYKNLQHLARSPPSL